MTKKAMKEFLNSEFYRELYNTIKAWDYYLTNGERELADQMMHQFKMAKLALKFITGNYYGFSRDSEGNFGLVNESDYSDRICVGGQ